MCLNNEGNALGVCFDSNTKPFRPNNNVSTLCGWYDDTIVNNDKLACGVRSVRMAVLNLWLTVGGPSGVGQFQRGYRKPGLCRCFASQ